MDAQLVQELWLCDLMKLSMAGTWKATVENAFGAYRTNAPGQEPPCIPKTAPGQSLILTPTELGMPILPAALNLWGTHIGYDGTGRPLVRFEAHQDLDAERFGMTLKRIDGDFVIALEKSDTAAGDPQCGGTGHLQALKFSVVDNDLHSLVIEGTYDGKPATVTVTVDRFDGVASRPKKEADVLVWFSPRDDCGVLAVEQSTMTFGALLTQVPVEQGNPLVAVEFLWSVEGAATAANEPLNTQWFHIMVPTAPEQFVVTLTITLRFQVDTLTLKRRTEFRALSLNEARMLQLACRIKKLTAGFTQINPIIDPLGPVARRPFQLDEIAMVRDASAQLATVAAAALERATRSRPR